MDEIHTEQKKCTKPLGLVPSSQFLERNSFAATAFDIITLADDTNGQQERCNNNIPLTFNMADETNTKMNGYGIAHGSGKKRMIEGIGERARSQCCD
jgi:hypothetical protein